MINLDTLESLAKEAEKDWYRDGYEDEYDNIRISAKQPQYTMVAYVPLSKNANYIVAVQPTAILELIAKIRELESMIDTLQDNDE